MNVLHVCVYRCVYMYCTYVFIWKETYGIFLRPRARTDRKRSRDSAVTVLWLRKRFLIDKDRWLCLHAVGMAAFFYANRFYSLKNDTSNSYLCALCFVLCALCFDSLLFYVLYCAVRTTRRINKMLSSEYQYYWDTIVRSTVDYRNHTPSHSFIIVVLSKTSNDYQPLN